VTHDLPDAETLARGRTAVLASPDVRDSVRVESRTVNPYTSSTASELIITLGRATKHRRTTRRARAEQGRD